MELLRAMGGEPLHVAFTSTGTSVALTIVSSGAAPIAGWGETFEEAMSNAYGVPEAVAKPAPPSRFQVVAGTDRHLP